MITIVDASNLYLLAKAFSKGQLQELSDKWSEPLLTAAIQMLRAQIEVYGTWVRVFCVECGLSTMSVPTRNFDPTPAAKLWNARPIEDALNKRIAELEEKQRWRVVADGELPEVYRDEDGEFIPFLVCEGDGDRPFIAMYGGTNWHAGIFVPDVTHWMPLPEPPEVK